SIGFTNSKEAGDEQADIKRLFSPEFRNRLDATVSFGSLTQDIIIRVVDKFLMQLEDQLHEKKVDVTFSDALKTYLGKKGFDPQMGARPMARLIQDTIRKALADELLFGRLNNGGAVHVDIDDKDQVKLVFSKDNQSRDELLATAD
ncbi:MAG: ATP-dependent Clp protease ATP-binding subunit ClpA, partial [Pseudomonadota bacterium]